MRISTNTIYELGAGSIQQQTGDLLKIQQQVASGRRILTPADDPVAAARALGISQSQSLNHQYGVNLEAAKSSLGLEEGILASVTTLIQDAKTAAINAGNPVLNNSDRASLATELRGRYQELLGLANSTDSNGQYLFSGYQGATPPFAETSPGSVAYSGDQGQRLIQVGAARQIAVSDSGFDVFQRIKSGNGTFVTAAASGNSGSATISQGTVVDATKWNASGKNFTIQFDPAGSGQYDILDGAGNSAFTGAAPTYPRTFASGSTISLKRTAGDPGALSFDAGADVSIQGTPASGDTFTVQASGNQSLFNTLNNLIIALETPISGGGSATLTSSLNAAMSNLDNSLDNVLTVRASIGARLSEIDSAKSTSEDLALQYQQTLSQLQDLDYAKAISELNQQQVNLEAAQKSFLKIQGLSLFSLI